MGLGQPIQDVGYFVGVAEVVCQVEGLLVVVQGLGVLAGMMAPSRAWYQPTALSASGSHTGLPRILYRCRVWVTSPLGRARLEEGFMKRRTPPQHSPSEWSE